MNIPHRSSTIYSVIVITVFIWIGFVCSISFMEAWIKFRAPHVTLPVGLGIGRIVFGALNKVEWILGGIVAAAAFSSIQKPKIAKSIFLHIPIVILAVQTSWLLPALNDRAESIIQGMSVLPSYIHFYYIFLEFIKVISLFILGLSAIRRLINTQERKNEQNQEEKPIEIQKLATAELDRSDDQNLHSSREP